jgi:hypothetical protein
VTLHPALFAAAPPAKAAFGAQLAEAHAAGGNPCAGKPAGTPCFVWQNPDGTTTVCTCDGEGNCVQPQ